MARFNSGNIGGFGPATFLSIFLVISDLGAFCLLLGGASALQHKATAVSGVLNLDHTSIVMGDLAPNTLPRNFISYEWFKAVFQVLTLLFCLACLVTGQVHRTRLAMVALLAVLATLWCDASNTFYYLHTYVDAAETVTGSYIAKAVRVYWAGCMLSAIFNFGLIIVLGSTAAVPTASEPAYATSTTKNPNPTYANENVGNGNGNSAV